MEELFFYQTEVKSTNEDIPVSVKQKHGTASRRRQLVFLIVASLAFLLTVMFVIMHVKADEAAPSRIKSFVSVEIRSGDTVWEIAERYRSEEYSSTLKLVKEIEKINHISGGNIKTGGHLIIPVYKDSSN